MDDWRRAIPRTDAVLALPAFTEAAARLGAARVKAAVRAAQELARQGVIAPDAVAAHALAMLDAPAPARAVLNATGVVVHTNLGRAPLSDAAVAALVAASGYTDVELDLATNTRVSRGVRVRALLAQRAGAQASLVVNNGAAALVLVATALGQGRELLISRGELVEIGAGFRLGDLLAATGARLVEVGATNRTRLADYAAAMGPATAAIVKVHPSNYVMSGYVEQASVAELVTLGVPVVHDIGSGLLRPDAALPDEPSASASLAAGADLVIASGDKLLGGPQAGLVVGRRDLIDVLARHPLARAVRVDKLTLAALEATLGAPTPVDAYRLADPALLKERAERIAAAVGAGVVETQGRIGGGGAPDVTLPGWAIALPPDAAARLRTGTPAVLARIDAGRTLIDLRCIDPDDDEAVLVAVQRALAAGAVGEPGMPGEPA